MGSASAGPLIPGAEHKALCPGCRKFFHPETGERVKELEHITVSNVDEKGLCRPCTDDRRTWDADR